MKSISLIDHNFSLLVFHVTNNSDLKSVQEVWKYCVEDTFCLQIKFFKVSQYYISILSLKVYQNNLNDTPTRVEYLWILSSLPKNQPNKKYIHAYIYFTLHKTVPNLFPALRIYQITNPVRSVKMHWSLNSCHVRTTIDEKCIFHFNYRFVIILLVNCSTNRHYKQTVTLFSQWVLIGIIYVYLRSDGQYSYQHPQYLAVCL